jgi:hypothetical protein
MTDEEAQADHDDMMWMRGERAALTGILEDCLRKLGYDSAEGSRVAWISERERTVAMLRQVCDIHGDNDWPNDLHLADVVEKHLWRNLEAKRS